MKPADEIHNELMDRILDVALEEVAGDVRPPQPVSLEEPPATNSKVQLAAEPARDGASHVATCQAPPHPSRRFWIVASGFVAACLLLVLCLPNPAHRFAARDNSAGDWLPATAPQANRGVAKRPGETTTLDPSDRAWESMHERLSQSNILEQQFSNLSDSGDNDGIAGYDTSWGDLSSLANADGNNDVLFGGQNSNDLAGLTAGSIPISGAAGSLGDAPRGAAVISTGDSLRLLPAQLDSRRLVVVNRHPGQRVYSYERLDSGQPAATEALAHVVSPSFHRRARIEEAGDRVTALGEGKGPGAGGDKYDRILENAFLGALDNPLSTFSIDVDTAAYANARQYLTQVGQLPPPDAVRIEELVNYFRYAYAPPPSEDPALPPFAAHMELASCPWAAGHQLLRIGLKGREVAEENRPRSNLVFLVDVSGSMGQPNKLPLVVSGLKTLVEHLGENDRIGIVVYASAEGLVLDSTPGSNREAIVAALDRLDAGGSTNGGAGIEMAYRIATDHFVPGGINRVLLCTDGDFNVGTTSTAQLERLVEDQAKSGVFLTVLGFGRGNLNDSMMETISNRGNGNYHYIDGRREAARVLVEEMGSTLVTIAKDVKIQIEFNPAEVASYRLIGYENRILAKEDFNDDTKDAGEIGAGHSVTALYEIVPAEAASQPTDRPAVDDLKYQHHPQPSAAAGRGELLTLKLRYKEPEQDSSRLLEFTLDEDAVAFGRASEDTQFAAAVAMFGMLLRDSQHRGTATWAGVQEIATDAIGEGGDEFRREFLELVKRARQLQAQ